MTQNNRARGVWPESGESDELVWLFVVFCVVAPSNADTQRLYSVFSVQKQSFSNREQKK
jgi:hypothetical protein